MKNSYPLQVNFNLERAYMIMKVIFVLVVFFIKPYFAVCGESLEMSLANLSDTPSRTFTTTPKPKSALKTSKSKMPFIIETDQGPLEFNPLPLKVRFKSDLPQKDCVHKTPRKLPESEFDPLRYDPLRIERYLLAKKENREYRKVSEILKHLPPEDVESLKGLEHDDFILAVLCNMNFTLEEVGIILSVSCDLGGSPYW